MSALISQKLLKISAAAALLICSLALPAQNGTWVWMHGSSTNNASANYGVQGVPSPTNDPPAMYETTELVDLQGNFWIFGGLDNNFVEQTALWKFDPVTNMWTWMKGPSTTGQPGVYGTMGVPSPANYPGSRAWGVAVAGSSVRSRSASPIPDAAILGPSSVTSWSWAVA